MTPIFVDWIKPVGEAYIRGPIKWRGSALEVDVVAKGQFTFGYGFNIGVGFEMYPDNGYYTIAMNGYYTRVYPLPTDKISIKIKTEDGAYFDGNRRITLGKPSSYFSQFTYTPVIFGSWRERSGSTVFYGDNQFLYNISSKNDGVLQCNLRPCYYNGEYGLWDTLTDTFYGKSGGAGTITGGYDE